jgi:hypothetical protein
MTQPKCKCHPDSPFVWRNVPRPSMFAKDPHFKGTNAMLSQNQTNVVEKKREEGIDISNLPGISKFERVINGKQFMVYSKAGKMI